MRHNQATLHVTKETKLSLSVEVEIEPADSILVDGHRVYILGVVSNATVIHRDSGSLLEKLRYRFSAGKDTESHTVLSPWSFRSEFLHEDAALRGCHAGLSIKKIGRGKAGRKMGVWPENNPIHSWALGLHGVVGSYVLVRDTKSDSGGDPPSPTEVFLDQECSTWRALIRDALTSDYAEWRQLASKHPSECVRELLSPLPFTIEAKANAPTARIVCQSLLDVLIATTQVDGIRGLRYRVCRAEGCGVLFPIGNYERKIYCDYPCAHRQAVRDGRTRKAKRQKRSTGKQN